MRGIVPAMVSFAPQRARLRTRLDEALRPAFAGHRSCALLDFLSVFNPGDALLELGAREFLCGAGIDVVYEADWLTFDAAELRRRLPPGGLIAFHGGGNINSLNWKDLNIGFRLEVLESFHDYPIVQLPQSVFFDDPALEEKTKRAFSSHPSFRMFARDARSKEFCEKRLSTPAELCPDMAFMIDLDASPARDRGRTIVFRHDNEMSGASAARDPAFGGYRHIYWLRKWDPFCLLFIALHPPAIVFKKLGLRGVFHAWNRLVTAYARWLARHQRRFIERSLRGSRVVVTDRLHASLSCVLLDVPFVALDNSYGKIRTFFETWMPELLERHTAETAAEAAALAAKLAP